MHTASITEAVKRRCRYLFHLRRADSPLLRRQEAEQEVFTVGSEQKSALVTHEEVAEWATGRKDALICSVSHGWETREHPDPCCFQLGQLADMVSLYQATYVSEIWLFYDYTSLYQFERTTDAQEQSFQRAMDNMHVMYHGQKKQTDPDGLQVPFEKVFGVGLEGPNTF